MFVHKGYKQKIIIIKAQSYRFCNNIVSLIIKSENPRVNNALNQYNVAAQLWTAQSPDLNPIIIIV